MLDFASVEKGENEMKRSKVLRVTALFMCALCIVSFVSCGGDSDTITTDTADTKGAEETVDTGDDDMKPNEKNTIASLTPSNGKKLKIAFVGDSITQGTGSGDQALYSFPAQLSRLVDKSKYEIGNFGKASSYVIPLDSEYHTDSHKKNPQLAYKNTQQYKDSIAFNPDVVVIMLGTNDVRSMSDANGWDAITKAIADLAAEYRDMESVQKVYISTSIRICNAAAIIQGCDGPLQAAQRKAAEQGGFELIDIYSDTHDYMNVKIHETSDKVHPNAEIYGVMAAYYKAALFGEDYAVPAPEKSDSGVVYVKSGGKTKGKGESVENALGSIATAVGLLRDGGGKIVICGSYTTSYETHLPEHNGIITVTSKHDGVDYSQSSGAKLGVKNNIYLYGDYVFEDVKISSEVQNSIIVCNYNNVKFGDGIVSTLGSGITSYPLLLVGYNIGIGGTPIEDVSLHGECNITVNSGTWAYIRGGNRRSNAAFPIGGSDSDAKLNITVNGGTYMNSSSNNLTAATGQNGFAGTVVLTINGGTFKGNVYAVGRVGGNTTSVKPQITGNIKLVISGGEFSAKIYAVQESAVAVSGKVSIEVLEKYTEKLVGFTDITKK